MKTLLSRGVFLTGVLCCLTVGWVRGQGEADSLGSAFEVTATTMKKNILEVGLEGGWSGVNTEYWPYGEGSLTGNTYRLSIKWPMSKQLISSGRGISTYIITDVVHSHMQGTFAYPYQSGGTESYTMRESISHIGIGPGVKFYRGIFFFDGSWSLGYGKYSASRTGNEQAYWDDDSIEGSTFSVNFRFAMGLKTTFGTSFFGVCGVTGSNHTVGHPYVGFGIGHLITKSIQYE